jgi:hypothetical protein
MWRLRDHEETEHIVAELAIRCLLCGLQVEGHMLRRDVDAIVSEQMDKPSPFPPTR